MEGVEDNLCRGSPLGGRSCCRGPLILLLWLVGFGETFFLSALLLGCREVVWGWTLGVVGNLFRVFPFLAVAALEAHLCFYAVLCEWEENAVDGWWGICFGW